MKYSIKKILLIIGILFFITGLTLSVLFNNIFTPSIEHVYKIEANEPYSVWGENGTLIDITLYEPKIDFDIYNKRPVAILVHGHPFDKSYMKGMAFELNKRGIVAICMSARGTAGSEGQFVSDVHFHNETLSIIQWIRNHNSSLRIDSDKIGLIGHSMGAVSVTNAAILDHELGNFWINCTVSIGGPVFNYTNEIGQDLAENLGIFNILYPINPIAFNFYYPQNYHDIEEAMKESILEGRINNITPYNYLNIIGSLDSSFSIESSQEVVWNMGEADIFEVLNFRDLPLNHFFGEFNGSARKLCVVPNVDHFSEIHDVTIIKETILWLEGSMLLNNSNSIIVTEPIRMLFLPFTLIGLFILFIPLTIYIGNYIKSNSSTKNIDETTISNDLIRKTTLYSVPYFSNSLVVFPLVLSLNLQNLIINGVQFFNLVILFSFIHSLLLFPFIIIFIGYEIKYKSKKIQDYGLSSDNLLKSSAYGTLIFLIFFILINSTISNNYFNFFPYRIDVFLQIFIFLFFIIFIKELFFRGLIQEKIKKFKGEKIWKIPGKDLIISTLINGTIQGLGIGIIFSMFLLYLKLEIDVIFSMIILFLLFSYLINAVQVWIYRKCKNLFGTTLFLSFCLAWFFSTFLPYI